MKQIIQTQIDKISAESSSIYSKEDVIKILTTLKDTPQEDNSSEGFLDKVAEIFKEKLESIEKDELVDYNTAQFRIDRYNEVVIDYIDVAEFTIYALLKESITEAKQS